MPQSTQQQRAYPTPANAAESTAARRWRGGRRAIVAAAAADRTDPSAVAEAAALTVADRTDQTMAGQNSKD